MSWIIDTTDGGLYRDEREYDPLPGRIGPFDTQDQAVAWLDARGPLWGSYSLAQLTRPEPEVQGVPSEDARVLCAWIDRTLALSVYQTAGRDTYAEGVVDTLKTVRKLLTKSVGSESAVPGEEQR